MQRLLAFLILICAALPAYAASYNSGQCPSSPPGVLINCDFQSADTYQPFTDTWTFVLGNTTESDGILVYASSIAVTATDGGLKSCSRSLCHFYYYTIIDKASIDGIAMLPPTAGNHTWALLISLMPGSHTMSVSGHGSNVPYLNPAWRASVQGIDYTLQPIPTALQ